MIMIVTSIVFTPKKVDAHYFYHVFTQEFDGVLIQWEKVDNAKEYRVYRLKVKANDYSEKSKKSYKRIKTVKDSKFFDEKMKSKTYYRYYIEAVNNEGEIICDSYEKYGGSTVRLFLESPDVEVIKTSKKKILFKVDSNIMMGPNEYTYTCKNKVRFAAYRKTKGAKKYKRIKTYYKKGFLTDYKVKPEKRYRYIFKTYLIYKHKKYVGKKTNVVEAASVNNRPILKFESITSPQLFKNQKETEIIIKVSNASKYNGNTFFMTKSNKNLDDTYCVQERNAVGALNGYYRYPLVIKKYSRNNVNWSNIGENGIKLPKKKALYLKIQIGFDESKYDSSDKTIHYAGDDEHYYLSYFDFTRSLKYEKESIFRRCHLVKFNKKCIKHS